MPLDTITCDLYEPNGTTLVGALTHVSEMTWQHELSKAGSGSFKLAATDPLFGQVTPRRIVKFSWRGAVRFAIRLKEESVQCAVEHGTALVAQVSGPGLLDMLHDAVVLPEYGLKRSSDQDRRFGFMSADGAWRVPAEWAVPTATVWSAYARAPEFPRNWPDPASSWLGHTGTETGYKTWYRGLFTTSADEPGVRMWFSADDEADIYLDGKRIFHVSASAEILNETHETDTFALPAGNHILAAAMTDVFQWVGEALHGEFMFSCATLDENGDPLVILAHSQAASWTVRNGTSTNGEPGWRRGQVIKACFDEAKARGCAGLQPLTLTFSDTLDSDGTAWADADRGDFNIPVATLPLDEVVTRLTEDLVDAEVDPVAMTLGFYNRKGADLAATVTLQLGRLDPVTASLMTYTTKQTAQVVNDLYGQLEDGTWVHTTEPSGVTAWGLVEGGAAVGSTSDDQTAVKILNGILARTADIVVSLEAQPSSLVGPVAYVDYQVGDSITVPGHRGVGLIKARVLAITVKQEGENVAAWPELVLDPT